MTVSSMAGFTLSCPSVPGFRHCGHSCFSQIALRTHCSELALDVVESRDWQKRDSTVEQKQWPHGKMTGATKGSPHILQRMAASSWRRPGATVSAGKSVGSEMS